MSAHQRIQETIRDILAAAETPRGQQSNRNSSDSTETPGPSVQAEPLVQSKCKTKWALSFDQMLENISTPLSNTSDPLASPSRQLPLTTGMARNFSIVTAPQNDSSMLPNQYIDIPAEVHFKIFDELVGDKVFPITSHMYEENTLRTLRKVNRRMYALVREYQKSCLTDTARKKLVISPDFGLFHPWTAEFLMDTSHITGNFFWQQDTIVEMNVCRANMVKFSAPQKHFEGVRYLTLKMRSHQPLCVLMEYIKEFRNLQRLEVILDRSHIQEKDAKKEEKSKEFQDMFWHLFWDRANFCHPGKCCTCCDLPDLTFLDVGTSSTGVSSSIPQTYRILERGLERVGRDRLNFSYYRPPREGLTHAEYTGTQGIMNRDYTCADILSALESKH